MSSSEPVRSAPVRLTHLDALRGVAILIVVGFHWLAFTFNRDHLPWNGILPDFAGAPPGFLPFLPVSFGFLGVPLFFVLSGFVIHYSTLPRLARGEAFDARTFFWRRFWRIVPAYYFALAVFALWSHPPLFDVAAHFFFVHNLTPRTLFSINPPFWSIATEVQFYLLYPLLLAIRARLGMKRTLLTVGMVSIVSRLAIGAFLLLTGQAGIDCQDAKQAFLWESVPVTWFDWCLGAYAAERFFHGRPPIPLRPAAWVVILLAPVLTILFRPLSAQAFTLGSIAAFFILERYARAGNTVRGNFTGAVERVFIFVGLISYSLYLWHQPLIQPFGIWLLPLLTAVGLGNPTGQMLVGGTVLLIPLLLLAWISFETLEKAGNYLGKRLAEKKKVARGS